MGRDYGRCLGRVDRRIPGTRPATVIDARCMLPSKRNGYCHLHAGQWMPGDPCGSCGNDNTYWTTATGAACRDCGATDADD